MGNQRSMGVFDDYRSEKKEFKSYLLSWMNSTPTLNTWLFSFPDEKSIDCQNIWSYSVHRVASGKCSTMWYFVYYFLTKYPDEEYLIPIHAIKGYSICSSVLISDTNIEHKRKFIKLFIEADGKLTQKDLNLHKLIIYEQLKDKVISFLNYKLLPNDIMKYIITLLIEIESIIF